MEWISVKDKLPEDGQEVEFKWLIPKGIHTENDKFFLTHGSEREKRGRHKKLEFNELRDIPQIMKGEFHGISKEKQEQCMNFMGFSHHCSWGGLRVDLGKYVTHWKELK